MIKSGVSINYYPIENKYEWCDKHLLGLRSVTREQFAEIERCICVEMT